MYNCGQFVMWLGTVPHGVHILCQPQLAAEAAPCSNKKRINSLKDNSYQGELIRFNVKFFFPISSFQDKFQHVRTPVFSRLAQKNCIQQGSSQIVFSARNRQFMQTLTCFSTFESVFLWNFYAKFWYKMEFLSTNCKEDNSFLDTFHLYFISKAKKFLCTVFCAFDIFRCLGDCHWAT